MNMMKLKKEVIEILKLIGVIVIIYFVIVGAFRYVPFLKKYDTYVIQTDSMVPVINVSDIVVIDNSITPDEIKVGNIMAFRVDITGDGKDDIVVHYVNEIIVDGDKLVYKTVSEKSGIEDSWTIEEEDIVGVYTFRVEYFGKILLFLQSWIGRVIVVVDFIIISLVYDMIMKKPKKKTRIIDEKSNTKKKNLKKHIE